MEKLLTISIAAYNVETYIRKCLDSLVHDEILDRIEVFVIDDGGTDSTATIAKEYENKYPGVFRTINKENEGYGSTVNYSINYARGKYFKLLDGDDWFDTTGLQRLVRHLEQLDEDVDVIFNDVGIFDDDGNQIIYDKCNEKSSVCCLKEYTPSKYFSMWYMTFKTSVLKRCNVKLPIHSLYTDQLLTVFPFTCVGKISFEPYLVYCYRVGRKDQSNALQSVQNHYTEAMDVCDICCGFYTENRERTNNISFIRIECVGFFRHVMKILLFLPGSKENRLIMQEYDKKIRDVAPDVYKGLTPRLYRKVGLLIWILRLTNYRTYGFIKLFVGRVIKWSPI